MIYILQSLKYKQINELSEVIDNVFESVSIEIETSNGKNIVITCLYRPPGTNIELFNEHLENLLSLVKLDKTYFLVGDFNINLSNYENHTASKNFADLLFSFGLYPLINKPTRISFDTATLIDNIFTNITAKNINGILINDISDHLPISPSYIKDFPRTKQSKMNQNTKLIKIN